MQSAEIGEGISGQVPLAELTDDFRIKLEAAPVLARKLMASQSQQSSAKAIRTLSPLSQPISKPSEHQRRLRWWTAMRPSCRRSAPLAWRSSKRPWTFITR
jgi:hypothetical protein